MTGPFAPAAPVQATGWHTIAAAFRSCRQLGWSPLPLDPVSKKPRFYSWPARCVVPLSDEELRRLYRPDCGIGVACGCGGLLVADVDAGGDAARKLLHDTWGPPLAVVLGGRPDGFKALYKGPWAEPPPELRQAALNYAVAGEALARAVGALNKARPAGEGSPTFSAAWAEHDKVVRRQDAAKEHFDRLQDEWIATNRLIRSGDRKLGADGIALQILSFGRHAVLPPSVHPKSPTGQYRWEGGAPHAD